LISLNQLFTFTVIACRVSGGIARNVNTKLQIAAPTFGKQKIILTFSSGTREALQNVPLAS
jgi:hypothetical protein